jgi:hypothetical protein
MCLNLTGLVGVKHLSRGDSTKMAPHVISNSVSSNPKTDFRSRRKSFRFEFPRTADWDFFNSGTGTKTGYIENISQGGCLLRTNDPIEHRRWVRIVVKSAHDNLWFTTVGRVIRRQEQMEAWGDSDVTLYRCGVEFIHPLNPRVLEQIQSNHLLCSVCGTRPASIPDNLVRNRQYCVLCHLRLACHQLLSQDGLG